MTRTLTPLQRRTLFMAIRPAAQEVGDDPESYRRRILREELGVALRYPTYREGLAALVEDARG